MVLQVSFCIIIIIIFTFDNDLVKASRHAFRDFSSHANKLTSGLHETVEWTQNSDSYGVFVVVNISFRHCLSMCHDVVPSATIILFYFVFIFPHINSFSNLSESLSLLY